MARKQRGVTPPTGTTRVLRVQRALTDVVEVAALWDAGRSVGGLRGGEKLRELEAAVDEYLRFHGTDAQRNARREVG